MYDNLLLGTPYSDDVCLLYNQIAEYIEGALEFEDDTWSIVDCVSTFKTFGIMGDGEQETTARKCVGPVVADSRILISGSSLLFEVQFKLIWRKVVQALMNPF